MTVSSLRETLVATGVEILDVDGATELTLREIARRAGVSHGAPRRYFPTHNSLLAAIASHGLRDLTDRLDPILAFEAVGGSGQNLGYAFQWPLFAAFVVYAYRKFVQLEDVDPEEAEAEEAAAEPREIPADLLPQRPQAEFDDVNLDVDDPEARQMLEYNDYLAQLAARESDRSTT
ncbi:TetR family transcriptional regulator [Streptomyces sp. NPDC002130]|uniref:TetR/AcrR family transcriptional regulator n=1 Tax=Streptomyces sp. NPDC002130 TaxID=3155568 RepID=UPI0033291C52